MTGDDFRIDRENRGLSQKAMADLLCVTEDVIRTIEAGRVPQPVNRFKVSAFYGMKVVDLWPVDERAA